MNMTEGTKSMHCATYMFLPHVYRWRKHFEGEEAMVV